MADGYLGLDGEPITIQKWCELYDHLAETRLSHTIQADPTLSVVTEWTGVAPPVSSLAGCAWEIRVQVNRVDEDDNPVHGEYVYLRARNREEAERGHWDTVKRLEMDARSRQRQTSGVRDRQAAISAGWVSR